MADLQKAKQAAQQVGQQPPAGITEGTPDYDKWVQQWFQGGVDAGDPRLLAIAGPDAGGTQAEEGGGHVSDFGNAASSADWMGKRKPTAQELRKWAKDTGRPEDYARYSDAAVSGWIARNWDVGKGTFVNNYGDSVDKPDERGPNTPAGFNGTGDRGGWDLPGQGGGGKGGMGGGGDQGPAPPPPPSTFGSQLGFTGNPLTDMLVQQFNTQSSNPNDPTAKNMFGLGEDRQVGGAGANADAQTNQGQLLQGGGLWWQGPQQEKGADAFGGFRADIKNAEPTAATGAAPAAASAGSAAQAPTPAEIATPPQNLPAPNNAPAPAQAQTTISGMLTDQYNKKKQDEYKNQF